MGIEADNIVLTLPFKAEYVSVVRLAVSGIASRMGFDIEAIEDIKVATAEVCNKMIEAGSKTAGYYTITFQISNLNLVIKFDCEDKSLKCIFSSAENELGVSIINALMDDVVFCSNDSFILLMSKAVERTS
jgi:serine/threonine-protein kinase RsbW